MSAPEVIMREVLAKAERFRKVEPPKDGVVLVNGADLTPEPVRWLWDGWLALGSSTSWPAPRGRARRPSRLASLPQ